MGLRTKSAQKKHRQNLKRRERNRFVTSTLKTKIKRYSEAIGSEDVEKSQDPSERVGFSYRQGRHERGYPQEKSLKVRIEVLKEALGPKQFPGCWFLGFLSSRFPRRSFSRSM